MHCELKGSPSFAYMNVALEPGESIQAEADAMTTMNADLDLKAKLNGGLLRGIAKSVLGGESLFINRFSNTTSAPLQLTLAQGLPGDSVAYDLNQGPVCLQPGAFIAATTDAEMGTRWAGLRSGISREGFFKLQVSGTGTVWFGAYGGIIEREIDGEYIVDTSHLVAYEESIELKLQWAGGFLSSIFGGEGLVTRVQGKGRIWIQTRSLSGLSGWLNPKI